MVMQDLKCNTVYKLSLRDKILDVAMPLFVANGIRSVKMDDIASILSVSKRTLYEIFQDKEDLLLAGLQRGDQKKLCRVRHIVATSCDVMDAIIALCKIQTEDINDVSLQYVSDISRYPRILEYFHTEEKNVTAFTKELIRRGVEEGYFLTTVNYDLVINLWIGQRKYVMNEQMYKNHSFKELYFNTTIVSLRGVCTLRGVERLDRYIRSL